MNVDDILLIGNAPDMIEKLFNHLKPLTLARFEILRQQLCQLSHDNYGKLLISESGSMFPDLAGVANTTTRVGSTCEFKS